MSTEAIEGVQSGWPGDPLATNGAVSMDFELLVATEAEQRLRLTLLRSPAGEQAESRQVVDAQTWPALARGNAEVPSQSPLRDARRRPHRAEPTAADCDLGQVLSALVFQGDVRDRWHGALGRAQELGRPLRLLLRFDAASEASGVCDWPWERLRDDGGLPLALSRSTPLARHLAAGRQTRLPLDDGPLRVLLAAATPQDLDRLDVERERVALARALGHHASFVLRSVLHAGPDRLRRALVEQRPHVLHFIGHGATRAGVGHLVLEDDRHALWVDPEALATLVADCIDLRLVVLACCHSADAGSSGERREAMSGGAAVTPVTPYSGLARALIRAGVPHVVAFRGAIADRAAWRFACGFYHRLACGDSVELAMVEGRQAIRHDAAQWDRPLLFQRADDGRLLRRRGEQSLPAAWRVHGGGVAVLGLGGLSLVGLAVAGYLALWHSPPVRDAWQLALLLVATLAGLAVRALHRSGPGTLAVWTWRCRGRRLLAVAGLCSALTLGLVWVQGRKAACLQRCGLLGCAGAGPAGPVDLWVDGAPELAAATRSALGSVAGLRVLEAVDPAFRRCVDLRLTVDSGNGQLLARLSDADGRLVDAFPVESAAFQEGDAESVLVLPLARRVVEALGIEPPSRFATVALDPRVEEWTRLGHLDLAGGDLERAAARFAAALDADPGYAPALQGAGLVELARGAPEAALGPLRQAAQRAPGVAPLQRSLARALEDSGDPSAAREAYREATRLDPFEPRSHNDLGRLLLEAGQLESAARELQLALGLARDADVEAVVRKNFGRLYLAQGRPADALQQLEIARRLHSPYAEAMFWRAEALDALDARATCDAWAEVVSTAPGPAHRYRARTALQARQCAAGAVP